MDDNLPIIKCRPDVRLSTFLAGKRKHGNIQQCYMCEGSWSEDSDWIPPHRKLNICTIIAVVEEHNETTSKVSHLMRWKKISVENPSAISGIGTPQDPLDDVFPSTSLPEAQHQESAKESFSNVSHPYCGHSELHESNGNTD